MLDILDQADDNLVDEGQQHSGEESQQSAGDEQATEIDENCDGVAFRPNRKENKSSIAHYVPFDVNKTSSLQQFKLFPTGLDGGQKNNHEAHQCAVDLNKFD